ncbi:MAG: TonB-dependent receptor [Bacteroidaceae bacterium]|nr:TonB-dependent receptor [Bacteroidaceae bacterium]
MFFRHLQLNEITVTGVTGDTKLKHSTAPISIVSPKVLRATSSANIIDAVSHQPGISQLTTGGSISKPIIRGLGYNRVVVMSDGVRQEGQQWGDEHGIEVDGSSVGSVEILKGPASLMYGSDAMAGVVILHPHSVMSEGEMRANFGSEYQTNNGLFGYNLSFAGNKGGFVWDALYSQKMAHAYKNKYDGYVPGSQFGEQAGRLMLGVNKSWGFSHLTASVYHLTPSIIEGERDEVTGELLCSTDNIKTYSKALPFQQVNHYKAVWDNFFNLPKGYLKAIIGYQQNRRQEFEESADEYELYFKLHTLTYDIRYVTQEFQGWKLSAGVGGMYQQSGNMGEEYLIPDYRLFDVGLYATATKTLGERWTLNGGVRFDHRHLHGDGLEEDGQMRFTDFTRNFDGVTGSIGAVCNINRHFNVRMNLARGFRTPNMAELASNGVHEGSIRYEIGSQQLKAEYSLQADLGLDFTSRYFSAQLAFFANRINNYIFTHRLPGEIEEGYLTYAYTQGDVRLLGFEVGLDFHPIHSIHFANTFSFVDAQLLNQPAQTKYLPFTPAPRWTSELKWELLHHSHTTVAHHHEQNVSHKALFNNLYVAVGLDYYLRQSHIYSADDTETVTPAYALLSFSAGTDVQLKGKKVAELYITVDNVLNTAYQNHLSRLKYADVNNVTGRRGIYNMGRNIMFKLVVPLSL